MTARNFIEDLNKDLSILIGLRIKSAEEYHNKKDAIIEKHLPINLKYNSWRLMTNKYEEVFSILFDIERDKRVKIDMAGTILKTQLIPSYPDVDIDMPLTKYLIAVDGKILAKKIKAQREYIETQKIKLQESEKHLTELLSSFEENNWHFKD